MSKSLGAKDASTIIKACVLAGIEPPTLNWFLGKRRTENWEDIISSAYDLVHEADMFVTYMKEDLENYAS